MIDTVRLRHLRAVAHHLALRDAIAAWPHNKQVRGDGSFLITNHPGRGWINPALWAAPTTRDGMRLNTAMITTADLLGVALSDGAILAALRHPEMPSTREIERLLISGWQPDYAGERPAKSKLSRQIGPASHAAVTERRITSPDGQQFWRRDVPERITVDVIVDVPGKPREPRTAWLWADGRLEFDLAKIEPWAEMPRAFAWRQLQRPIAQISRECRQRILQTAQVKFGRVA